MKRFLLFVAVISIAFNTTYHTYVYDHHGNICNVVNQNGTLEQRYNYYPYGGLTNELSYDVDTQNRKSKE